MNDPADREFRLALWKLHILHHAAEGEVYGLWMLNELAEHGHQVSPGTLYPIFTRMVRNGWLEPVPGAGTGKAKRAYRITKEGRLLLARLRNEVAELHAELTPRKRKRP